MPEIDLTDYIWSILTSEDSADPIVLKHCIKLDFVNFVDAQLARHGETFEGRVGIDWIENPEGIIQPEREITAAEQWSATLEWFAARDDELLYWPDDEDGKASFLQAADARGIKDKAQELIEQNLQLTQPLYT